MTPVDLLYWLKGHFELSNEPPTREQWGVIRAKVLATPPRTDDVFVTERLPTMPESLRRALETSGCVNCGPAPTGEIPLPVLDVGKLG